MEIAKFHYLQWQKLYTTEKPFQILIDLPKNAADKRTTNLVFSEGPEECIEDVRQEMDGYKLDTYGFMYKQSPTSLGMHQFTQKREIEDTYLPECEQVLRDVMDGVDEVHFYNWLV